MANRDKSQLIISGRIGQDQTGANFRRHALELIAKVAMGRVVFSLSAWQGARREHTRRAGVLLPCGFVAHSSLSFGYAPRSSPRRKAKSLPSQPMSTFAMRSIVG